LSAPGRHATRLTAATRSSTYENGALVDQPFTEFSQQLDGNNAHITFAPGFWAAEYAIPPKWGLGRHRLVWLERASGDYADSLTLYVGICVSGYPVRPGIMGAFEG
jgi:hypothetical protein